MFVPQMHGSGCPEVKSPPQQQQLLLSCAAGAGRCLPGWAPLARGGCAACRPGTASPDGAACRPCSASSYAPGSGAPRCLDCLTNGALTIGGGGGSINCRNPIANAARTACGKQPRCAHLICCGCRALEQVLLVPIRPGCSAMSAGCTADDHFMSACSAPAAQGVTEWRGYSSGVSRHLHQCPEHWRRCCGAATAGAPRSDLLYAGSFKMCAM